MHQRAQIHSQPPSKFSHTRLYTLLATLLAALVLLPLLGHRPLTDWDEGIYAEIAREMLATHTLQGWFVPHWNGHLWFEKPPLQMWFTAASLRVFGLNAFAARLPSALAGIATVALLHAWLERRCDRLTGLLSTLILLSAFGFQHAARVGETDTLLTLFCLVAVLGLADLLLDHPKGWLFFFLGFGLALMTKGAASLPLPITALLLAARNPRQLLRHASTFTAGLLLFLALILPWHLYVYAHFGRAFLHVYLGFHTLTRATGAIEGHHTHPWFYLWVLLISAPLFSLIYPFALAAPFRHPTRNQEAHHHRPDPLQAAAAFALVSLLLFSAAGTRLPHYIAPTYPAFAALTAALVAAGLKRQLSWGPKIAFALAGAAILLYAASALLTAKARKALHNAQLINGYITPDNRESVALLQQLQRADPASLPAGPLLLWRASPVVPITVAAFYAHRLAQQVSLAPPPPNLPPDPYFNQPAPLSTVASSPRLLLLDNSLAPSLPPNLKLRSIAAGPTQTLAVLSPTSVTVPPESQFTLPRQPR